MSSEEPLGRKLWVGNLDKRLTEYDLLKIFQQYGEVENFEYLFHTVGPNKGEPRTYCFVEYKRRKDAECALQKLSGKVILSQHLKVHWAKENVKSQIVDSPKVQSKVNEQPLPNPALSREEKIQAIERKLKLMEHPDDEKPRPVLFHGKHRLLVESDQRKELSRKSRQKSRRPYSVTKK